MCLVPQKLQKKYVIDHATGKCQYVCIRIPKYKTGYFSFDLVSSPPKNPPVCFISLVMVLGGNLMLWLCSHVALLFDMRR